MTATLPPLNYPLPDWVVEGVMNLVAAAYNAGHAAGAATVIATGPTVAAPKEHLTRYEAAEFLGIGLTKFDRLVAADDIPTFVIGANRYAKRSELQQWLDQQPRTARPAQRPEGSGDGAGVSRMPTRPEARRPRSD